MSSFKPSKGGKASTKAPQQCSICDETKESLVRVTPKCKHEAKYCEDCLVAHVREAIVGKGDVTTVQCPDLACRQKMEAECVLHHLREKKHSALRDQADQLFFRAWTTSQPNFHWCANPKGCGAGFDLEESVDEVNFFTCSTCTTKTCVRHKLTWHPEMSCDEFDDFLKISDLESQAFMDANYKKCPNCSNIIEKAEGCNVMTCCMKGTDTCRRARANGGSCDHGTRDCCGHTFCWICLGAIDQDGTRHHKPGCQYAD